VGVTHIDIDEIVLDGFERDAPELPKHVAGQVEQALIARRLGAEHARQISIAVGEQVARSVAG
jgi:hypothetical protein